MIMYIIKNALLCIFVFDIFMNGMCNVYKKGAVTANGISCARTGTEIMKRGGSAADAAIATMLCDGVTCGERLGLGGGFMLTYFHRAKRQVETLLAREVAPKAAHKNMYKGNRHASVYGGLAVAVPGELKGYWELHQKYGKLPWAELFEEAIRLCEEGIEAAPFVKKCLKQYENLVMNSPSLRPVYSGFCTAFANNKPRIYRPQLAKTLKLVAKYGPDALYDGVLTDAFLKDIRKNGGIITKKDLQDYKPVWMKPIVGRLTKDLTFYSVPPPGSGVVLLLILQVMKGLPTCDEKEFWQYMAEVLKYAYGYRTRLTDITYDDSIIDAMNHMMTKETIEHVRNRIRKMVRTSTNYHEYGVEYMEKDDTGTAHINVLHPNGDAIAVTASINFLFGAMFRSESTGIILNNHMNDFSFPDENKKFGLQPSPLNFIEPMKHPMSSMNPAIIIDKNWNVRLMIGAAGGSKIISAVGTVLCRHLFLKENMDKAIFQPRIHHQLIPMTLFHEADFDQDIREHLEKLGHKTEPLPVSSCVSTITRSAAGIIKTTSDHRRSYSNHGL